MDDQEYQGYQIPWVRVIIGGCLLAGSVIAYGRTAQVYQQTTAKITICMGIWIGLILYAGGRRMIELRSQADAAERTLAMSQTVHAIDDAREAEAYYRDRCRALEREVADLRAQLAESKAGAVEAAYWRDRYKPKLHRAPDNEPTDEGHKFVSASGKTGKEQQERAYQLHLAGRSDEEVTDMLGVAVSTAQRYIRAGKHVARDLNAPNPDWDPDPDKQYGECSPWSNPKTITVCPDIDTDDYARECKRRDAAGAL